MLEDIFAKFEDLLARGAPFSALTRLGEIKLLLGKLPSHEKAEWRERLSSPRFAGLDWNERSEIADIVARIRRLTESDRDLQFDEYCLLLSLRFDVMCAVAYLTRENEEALNEDALKTIDSFLLEMVTDDAKRQKMARAAVFISKNLGMRFEPSELLPVGWAH